MKFRINLEAEAEDGEVLRTLIGIAERVMENIRSFADSQTTKGEGSETTKGEES